MLRKVFLGLLLAGLTAITGCMIHDDGYYPYGYGQPYYYNDYSPGYYGPYYDYPFWFGSGYLFNDLGRGNGDFNRRRGDFDHDRGDFDHGHESHGHEGSGGHGGGHRR